MNALKVFSEALRYLKEDALKSISANTHGSKFKEYDFTWVLTVPAIWGSSAKQFMRIAATQVTTTTISRDRKSRVDVFQNKYCFISNFRLAL